MRKELTEYLAAIDNDQMLAKIKAAAATRLHPSPTPSPNPLLSILHAVETAERTGDVEDWADELSPDEKIWLTPCIALLAKLLTR